MQLKPKRNKGAGLALLVVSLVVFFLYAYILLFSTLSLLIIEATVLAGVGVLLLVIGWIGYTMLTAPSAKEATK